MKIVLAWAMYSCAFNHIFRSRAPSCILNQLCIKVEGSRTVFYFLLASFHAICCLKQVGRSKQAHLGLCCCKKLVEEQLIQELWSHLFLLLLPSWPTTTYPTGSISKRIMYHWHLHHKLLKYRIKELPLDISIEVVFKEKYEEENSALPDMLINLVQFYWNQEIRPGNFIFCLRKQDSTTGLLHCGGKPNPHQMFVLIW